MSRYHNTRLNIIRSLRMDDFDKMLLRCLANKEFEEILYYV